jgi:hypothetical protein
MKHFKWILFIFFISVENVKANDIKFGWNIGNIKLSYDVINNTPVFDCELLHFNLLFNKISFGFNALEIYNLDNDENNKFSTLPFEIAFVPINFKNILFFSIYGKAGLELIQFNDNNLIDKEFYGVIGMKLFIFPKLIFNYSPYLSIFTEYNTQNELKIGMGIDLSGIIYVALMTFKENKEKE